MTFFSLSALSKFQPAREWSMPIGFGGYLYADVHNYFFRAARATLQLLSVARNCRVAILIDGQEPFFSEAI